MVLKGVWNFPRLMTLSFYAQKFPMQSKDQPATSQSTSQRKKAEGLSPAKESEQLQKATKPKGKK